jgi:hypothetical protein
MITAHAKTSGSIKVDAETMNGKDVTFGAGRDLRFHVADLTSLRLRVKDIGGGRNRFTSSRAGMSPL